ncbi:ExbD/TolR family protein [Tropicimonas sp.]|uniref:ExbD/TolR family protein n=1 Tax=Tropicimonas sp. TaxID=2067044 RepID=UPI003A83CA16
MKLARPRRRDRPEPIIALIDVVFFLLVFSMLVGRMDATAPFEVTPATSSTGSIMPGGGTTVSLSSDGVLALNGSRTGSGALLDTLAETLRSRPDTLVRVNAHRDSAMSELLPLIARIEALGANDIVLVVTPGETR